MKCFNDQPVFCLESPPIVSQQISEDRGRHVLAAGPQRRQAKSRADLFQQCFDADPLLERHFAARSTAEPRYELTAHTLPGPMSERP